MAKEVACVHRPGAGIYCDTPNGCARCGWNYAYESLRKARIRDKMREAPPKTYYIGAGSFDRIEKMS